MNQQSAQIDLEPLKIELDEDMERLSSEQLDLIGGGECVLNGI